MPPVLQPVEDIAPLSPTPHARAVSLHVVFSAECIPAFDWESIGLFYSFRRSRQPGKITRLLACSDDQLKTYPRVNMEMGPTFVHKNMRFDHEFNDEEMHDEFQDQKGQGYASYNKPYSVTAWLQQVEVKETWVLMMDTDMFLRAPIDPVALGVRRGHVVSAEYTYLHGTTSGFASRFLDESLHARMAQVGGFHIFHREDLRAISPKWLRYTRRVRDFANKNPDAFFNESFREDGGASAMDRSTHHKQARWHTEMYGYVFAAAEVGVTHRIRRDVMLYPSYEPYLGRLPYIMHYGSDYTLGHSYFNKMAHQELRLERCPNFVFDDPQLTHLDQLGKKDALTLEHLATLNAAFCEFYATRANCSVLPAQCGERDGTGSAYLNWLDAIQPSLARCVDEHEGCKGWADNGECLHNPLFMHSSCPVACESCGKPVGELVPDDERRGDWKRGSTERVAERGATLAYVDSADEAELQELLARVEKKRAALAAELDDEDDENVHTEL